METPSRVKDKETFILRRSELGSFSTSGAPAPWNHGLMKLHKLGFPLRDISDASQSPGHALAKKLNKLFVGYTGKNKHHLNSHSDLISILKTGRFDKGFFISFDAVELYPSIIIEDALQLLEQKMDMDSEWTKKTDLSRTEVLRLVRLLISSPYFECELGFFQQAKGTPMGGPLSRLLADLILENKIENKIQADREWKYLFNWVRLIDDTFMNWEESEEKLQKFFEYLNSVYAPIKWTMEREQDGKFHVFDIALIRSGNVVQTSVYRKPSASDRYLHFTSAQAWHEKTAAIHTLTLRALNYCSTQQLLDAELKYITQVFLDNGFPLKSIQRIIEMKSHDKEAKQSVDELDENHIENEQIDFSKSFYAPYHPRAKKMFRSLQKSFGINVVYKKTQTLGNLLFKRRPRKDKWETSHVVYSVPCEEPEHQYIGQTKRPLKVRVREHERSCEGDLTGIQPDENNDNGIPFHHYTTGHAFLFNQTKILAREKNAFRRKVIEGIHIANKKNSCVNIIAGKKIENIWMPLVQDLRLS